MRTDASCHRPFNEKLADTWLPGLHIVSDLLVEEAVSQCTVRPYNQILVSVLVAKSTNLCTV